MRRRKLLAAVGLAVVVAAGMVVLWPRANQPDRVTEENYDRIQHGMTRTEVEAILGSPGDYTTGPTLVRYPDGRSARHSYVSDRWVTDSLVVYVSFDDSDRVWHSFTLPNLRHERGLLDSLLWRAKRLWRRWFPE
jgi:hypothetical protein